ncbi:MAG: cytochrome c biogenesis protein CcsA, partial [Alphaproteobacteria bacterium]|nr:cytochrome c biogenesis protein CcsA [Alphaproteobacteria bacterium]
MIAESGHFALILAFCVACLQASMLLFSARIKQQTAHPPIMRLAAVTMSAALVQFALLLWAFMALTIGFIQSDFSLQIVAANSHAAKPLLYKIAGVWGNHEGSMLLWNLILAAYGAGFALWGGLLPALFKLRVLAVQALLGVAFLAFSLFTSNPFARLLPPPFEGMGLNPILQDPALALHPPILYLGYVGFSIVFAFTMATLIGRQIEDNWARILGVWILPPWICLTLGIALGSFWAY